LATTKQNEIHAARHVAHVAAAFLSGDMDRDALLNAVTDWRVARGRLESEASPRRGGVGGGASLPLLTPTSIQPTEQNQSQKSYDRRRRETWLTPFGAAWSQRYGCPLEAVPWGQLARYLKPLVAAVVASPESSGFPKIAENVATETVLGRWANYLAATEARFASPARFAATYGTWDRPAAAHAASSLEERPGESVDEYIRRQAAGGFRAGQR